VRHERGARTRQVINVAAASILGIVLIGCRQMAGPSGESTDPAVFVGAGDIGWCGGDGPEATARLLDQTPGTVFTTGDNAYPVGSFADFQQCYAPSWGRHLARTRPSPGNHDYDTSGAEGYFRYFGGMAGPAGVGYYSFDLSAWHIVSLNSNVPMHTGSAQEEWLQTDLRTTTKHCLLAYWHHPLFSSGLHGNDDRSRDIWRLLDERDAEVVLNGHDHLYERFAPQTHTGERDSTGIRAFVIGTGGAPPYSVVTTRPNSEVTFTGVFGVLKLTLQSSAYRWEFITVGGRVVDEGNSTCT
jgi:acid phosphatase type 7